MSCQATLRIDGCGPVWTVDTGNHQAFPTVSLPALLFHNDAVFLKTLLETSECDICLQGLLLALML